MIKEHDKSNDNMNEIEDKNSVGDVKDNKDDRNKNVAKPVNRKDLINEKEKKDDCNIL
jgi:hypothetical protein